MILENIFVNLKMSVPSSEVEKDEALRVAETMSAHDYFLNAEEKLIEEWADKSVKLFKYQTSHTASQERCSKASMKSSHPIWLSISQRTMKDFTTKAKNSSRRIAFSTAR